ncbi:MAG: DUF4238 domain-containing protein [candidate division Zixibacteria bacterium]|nr:DUF4238 domain-containing protein [candidate division Zixibacteria bacterium]
MVDIPDRFLEKRRQHTIPKFYLTNFTDKRQGRDGLLWRYERGGNDPVRMSPSNAAVIKDFYLATDVDGKEHNLFEEHLFKVEEVTAPVIRAIIEDGTYPDDDGHAALSLFVASMLYRTTAFRKESDDFALSAFEALVFEKAKDKERFHSDLREAKNKGLDPNIDPEQMRQFILKREYSLKPNVNLSLQAYYVLYAELANVVALMRHTIMVAKSGVEFLTSDNPVTVISSHIPTGTWGGDLHRVGTQISLPLSPQYVYFSSWDGPCSFSSCQPAMERNINKRTACRAHHYVFSPFRGSFINRWLNEQEPWIPKVSWPPSRPLPKDQHLG